MIGPVLGGAGPMSYLPRMLRLICAIIGHARRKGSVRSQGGHHYAACARCGTTLFRDPNRGWRAARALDRLPREIDLVNLPDPVEPASKRRRRRRRAGG